MAALDSWSKKWTSHRRDERSFFLYIYFHDRIKPQSCSVHESTVVDLLFGLHVQQEDYTTYDVFWKMLSYNSINFVSSFYGHKCYSQPRQTNLLAFSVCSTPMDEQIDVSVLLS